MEKVIPHLGNQRLVTVALALLNAGGNQAALDKVAPLDTHSPRQRQKIVSCARSNLKIHSEEQAIINRMTNWQRNQWGKAGSPIGKEQLEQFASMKRAA